MNAGHEMNNDEDRIDQLSSRVDRLEAVCQDLLGRVIRIEAKLENMVTRAEFQEFTERVYGKLNEMAMNIAAQNLKIAEQTLMIADQNRVIAEQYKAMNGQTWKFVTVVITVCTALVGATYYIVHYGPG
ncbi:hypothetical protein E4L96_03055 [Massilia arenosa]|uniref:Uncharacterized protein n=1 Tax=Zemynaea arenosa TaxID=2561931 RepID=A0A4Y9SR95_9BURK|nr:hypothetical protein [Massilia arenosa]TFW27997.1 hypothetical protein E4L96_03055 [Massilia arenosa]